MDVDPAGGKTPGRTAKVWRVRRKDGGVMMGLCAGLGAHLGIDPVVIRLLLVILAFLNPAGLAIILVYLLFSLFVPYAPEGEG